MTPRPPGITDRQWQARQAYDRDPEAAFAALDLIPSAAPKRTHRGALGYRMQSHYAAKVSDGLLREFARQTLKAQRISAAYLGSLRIVLGNQAVAERCGYILEMNRTVCFAPENTVRTIIDQMRAAGITESRLGIYGQGQSQVVQCFSSNEDDYDAGPDALERLYRQGEGQQPCGPPRNPPLGDEELPY